MTYPDRWNLNSDITRKPKNTDDFTMRFAAGKIRPYDDEYASISVGPATWENHRGKEINGFRFTHYATDIAYLSADGLTMWISSENWSAMTSKVLSSLRGAARNYGFRETIWAIRKRVGRQYYAGTVEFVMYKRSAKDRDNAAEDYTKKYKSHEARPWGGWGNCH